MFVSPIQQILEDLHSRLKELRAGEVASYIPELAKADPEWFGICLVTADGQVYEVGDTQQAFTIQSISKPFVYGMALEDNGKSEVLKKIWMEPSGEAFNAISLRDGTGQPHNPMINAGAIASTSLVEGRGTAQKIHRIVDAMSRFAGRELEVDEVVYQSESSTGHRNRAIAYMLRNFGIIEEDPLPGLEAYFQQCAISVTCHDLGVMAATLANGGINPITGVRAVVADYIENILSVMGSCGMYDAAGEWIYNVGMPAKSGVAGGILAVLPGQLGLAVFSPRLDSHGNSVRGVEVCREISSRFDLHMFHVPRTARSVLRRSRNLTTLHSNRFRSVAEMEVLRRTGNQVMLHELQGELIFGSAEVAVREFSKACDTVTEMIWDFSRVTAVDLSACTVFAMGVDSWLSIGHRVSLSGSAHLPLLGKVLRHQLGGRFSEIVMYPDQDAALEAAESRLLDESESRRPSRCRISLGECELLNGISESDLALMESRVKPCSFAEGETILRPGDPAGGVFFILQGKASVWLANGPDHSRRVATFSAGMCFGEMALADQSVRSAIVCADTQLEVVELGQEDFQEFASLSPTLHALLLKNLARLLTRRLREANEKLSSG